MMLAALYDLARRERLVDDPDFEKKRVDYFLHVDRDGRFIGLMPTAGNDDRAATIPVPRFPKRSGTGTTPGFLFDNAKYVLGLGGEGADGGRNEKCVEAFCGLVDALDAATGDEGAAAVARFYERRREQLAEITAAGPDKGWSGSEWIAFKLDGDEGQRPVHERPAVRAYWIAQRGAEDTGAGPPVRCLVTGQVGAPARTHGSIKRVPEAQTSGATLVTFNAEAFTSHGLAQGDNAPISRAAAEGYVTALNWLLEGTPDRRFQYGIPVGDGAVTVFWTRKRHEIADFLMNLMSPPPVSDQMGEMLASPWKGLEPADLDDTAFYAVTLGGNAARVVVRDWLETTVARLKRHLRAWFEALQIAGDDGRPLPIRRLLASVEPPSGRGLSPDLASRLFRSALSGAPLPRELLAAALRRLRLPPDKLDERRLLHARCALVKATLLRPCWRAPLEVSVSLDESNTDRSYLLGRLFAVLERLQGVAQGDINATIRDRYFGAASSTPAFVFPRLIRLSMHHAAKADGAGWAEQLKGKIIGALPAKPFPPTLSLDDQGLFAIGYYHQRQKFFEKRAETTPPADVAETATA